MPNNLYGWGRIDAAAHGLSLTKAANAEQVVPGATLTYTLSLTHYHLLSPTFGVVLTDTLPAGAIFVSASQPYTLEGGTVRWEFDSLQAGETIQVELVVRVADDWHGWLVNEHPRSLEHGDSRACHRPSGLHLC